MASLDGPRPRTPEKGRCDPNLGGNTADQARNWGFLGGIFSEIERGSDTGRATGFQLASRASQAFQTPQATVSPKTKSQNLIVEDVISAIYAGSVEGGPNGNLQSQIKRVAVELSRRKASQFTKRLLDGLSENPEELVQLEALVVLGFAHPEVMRKHHIALATEGRRLGVLLEKAGRPERAKEIFEVLCSMAPTERTLELELAGVMRRSGQTKELIDRYMERAQQHMQRGEKDLALPWLQEVLALDRTRTDVTALIREVRHDQHHKITSKRSNRRFVLAFAVFAGLFGALGYREWNIQKQYTAVPQANLANLVSIEERSMALSTLRDEQKLWLGRYRVDSEIQSLADQKAKILQKVAEEVESQQREMAEKLQMAEDWRLQGLEAVDRSDWTKARECFEKALAVAPPAWKHRAALLTDVEALRTAEEGK